MNIKLSWFILAAALAVLPCGYASAQDGPQGEDEEIEVNEGGGPGAMGPGGPGMRPGRKGGQMGGQRRMMWTEEEDEDDGEEGGQRQVTVKVRKMKGGGAGMFRGQEMGGGMGARARGMFMSEEDVMSTIKKYDAAFAKKVEDMKLVAMAKYRMVMNMAGKMLAGAKMEEDPALEKDAVRGLALEFECKELSRKYEKAADGEKGAIKTELKGKLTELFDLKTKGQELRMKRMEQQISKHKASLDKRKANKASIVEQRIDQLTGEGTGW